MSNVPKRSQIRKGSIVSIVIKKDQDTGNLTSGTVREILTSSEFHSHGIKVRLETGPVGRVKSIDG